MTNSTAEYKGFIANGVDGLLRWHGSNDDKALLEADPDRVQFVATTDELIARLRRKHPDLDEQYGYVYNGGGYIRHCVEQRSDPVFYVNPKDGYFGATERDYRTLERLARKYGQVVVGNSGLLHTHPTSSLQFGPDFMVIGHRLIYSPKEAARRRKQRYESPVSNSELARATFGFYDELFRQNRTDLWPVCCIIRSGSTGTLNGCAYNFMGFWKLCVRFHGIRKTRNTKAMKELLARWKVSRERNDKKWTDAGCAGVILVKTMGELIDGRKRKEVAACEEA